ncbi:MAG: repeat-containing protein, partial [Verrucomicrobiaceae bacterium]|nr:repeat-containing protein [Verrucomicrobiaceae bacterium]
TASTQEAMVGDPVSVDLVIEGQGNFDALNAPVLTQPENWKLYPPRRYNVDNADPNTVDMLHRGVGFSTIVVPEKIMPAVPPFEFSFFNNRDKKYVTVRSSPIPITIKPSDKVAPPVSAEIADGSAPTAKPVANPAPVPEITDILTRLPAVPHWAMASVPLMQDTRFKVFNALLCLSFLGLVGAALFKRWRLRQVQSEDQERRAHLREVETGGLSEAEFYRRAAQYLHRYGGGTVPEAAKTLLEKYEKLNFAGPQAGAGPVDPADRAEALAVLKQLKTKQTSAASRSLVTALLLATMAGSAWSAEPQPTNAYQEAAQKLEKEDYKGAQQLGEKMVEQGLISPELFTLLGHAAYKQENLGGATIWYQRARLFPTAMPELRQNLKHLSEKIHFFAFPHSEWLDALVLIASRNQWALLATIGGWLAVFSIAFLVLGARRKLRNWVIATLAMGVLGLALGVVGWFLRPDFKKLENLVFVTATDAQAHTAAAEISGHVIAIPPGSTVRRIEERGAWCYVEVPQPDGNVFGWLLNKDLVPVWPFDPAKLP